MTNDQFKCELCSKSFATKFSRDRHLMNETCKRTSSKNFKSCPHCFKVFSSNSSKCRHVSNNVCGWKEETAPVLVTNKQCHRCLRIFSSNNAKCRHVRANICLSSSNAGPLPCPPSGEPVACPPSGEPVPCPPLGEPPPCPPLGEPVACPPLGEPPRFVCDGCNMEFRQLRYLSKHRQICKGTTCLACPHCHRIFKTRQSKNNHIRNMICGGEKFVRNFGEEDFSHILNSPDYEVRIKELMTMGKYAIPELLSQMYLDKRYPKNITLRKIRRNDRYVEIRIHGAWMRRLMIDVIELMLKRMELVHKPYFTRMRDALCQKNRDTNYRRMVYPLRVYAHIMLWYGWRCEEISDLTMLNYPEDDAEQRRRWTDINNICMEKIYEKTKEFRSIIL